MKIEAELHQTETEQRLKLRFKGFEHIKTEYLAILESLQMYPNVMDSKEGRHLQRQAIHYHKLIKNMPFCLIQMVADPEEQLTLANFIHSLEMIQDLDLSEKEDS